MDTEPTTDFQSLKLSEPVLKAVLEQGYETATPIQAQSIPQLLAGKDLLGQAQTGTGKTAAFALPLLSKLDLNSRQPQLLILTPTRELALQVAEACKAYAKHMTGFTILPVYGGQGMSVQLRQLQRGAQVIVGTPGRVMDHLRRKTLALGDLKALVLDEADEMLKMGFIDDIQWIFEQAPAERQVALFSATMPDAIRKITKRYLKDPVEIKVKSKTETVTAIDQVHYIINRQNKMDALTRILEVESFDGMIIFVRTKLATVEVSDKLEAHGFAAQALNGDMNQQMRERTVGRLKSGQLDIVVATDVAARGLDVERISHVVNFDIPNDPQSYVHRIGRTGRAGRKGKALLFVQPRERRLLKDIERSTRQPIPLMTLPTANEVGEYRVGQFVAKLQETLSGQDLDYYYQLISRLQTEQEISSLDIAAALTYLAQQDRPFVVKDPVPERKARDRKPEVRDRRPEAAERKPRRGDKPEVKRERPRKEKALVDEDGKAVPTETYRLQVGHKHGATPSQIMGAIANEAGIEGRYIGRIDIQDDHSLVDLPEGMPKEVYHHLQKVYVAGQALRLKNLSRETAPKEDKAAGKKRKKSKVKKPKKSDSAKPE